LSELCRDKVVDHRDMYNKLQRSLDEQESLACEVEEAWGVTAKLEIGVLKILREREGGLTHAERHYIRQLGRDYRC
jgi:hypothetical protein